MKKLNTLFLITILCLTINQIKTQDVSTWRQFLKDSVYNSDNNNYVYLYKTLDGKAQKELRYTLKNDKYNLAIIYTDTAFEEKEIKYPYLFKIVSDNYEDLLTLKKFLWNNKKSHLDHKPGFSNQSVLFTQLGIRFGEIHYNHFPKFGLEEMGNKKNEKLKKGMEIINKLYKILEEAEKN